MIRKLISWILDWLAGMFEREVDPRTIREIIEIKYAQLKDNHNIGETVQSDLIALEQIMVELGWLETSGQATDNVKEEIITAGIKWYSPQGLVPGVGKALDHLNIQGHQEVAGMLEKILRHVEVKREKSISKFTQPLTRMEIWLERCDISILFSRTARRRQDLRFLNASLKMNDWYLRQIGNIRSCEITARFMRALAEQELSAKELLGC